MAEATGLQAVSGRGWRRGMATLIRAEMAGWWRTRRWLAASATWVVAINAILLFSILGARSAGDAQREARREILRTTLEVEAEQGSEAAKRRLERMDGGLDGGGVPDSLMLYSIFSGLFVAIGTVIVLQGAVVGEKRQGTAEWVLSGPVSRPAFVLAKLAGNAAGVLATSVALPAALAYLEMTALEGLRLPLAGFLAGIGAIALHTLFYLALTLMLGTLLDHWAPVVAVPLGCLALQNILPGPMPALARLLPWSLVLPVGEQESVAVALMRGAAPASLAPVAVAAACTLAFVAVAVLRFRREEF